MHKLKLNIQNDIENYNSMLIHSISEFIDSIDIKDDFNYSYLFLFIILMNCREDFYKILSKKIHQFWCSDETEFIQYIAKLELYKLNDDINGINNVKKMISEYDLYFMENEKIWLDKIKKDYSLFIKDFDFELMSYVDISKIKGKKSKEIAEAFNYNIFNTDGWAEFIFNIVKREMRDFEIIEEKKMHFAIKEINGYKIKISVEPNTILNIKEILSQYGFFMFGFNLSIEENMGNKNIFYPPELTLIPNELLQYRKYSPEYKKAYNEEARIAIFANTKAYCHLIKIILPNLEKYLF